MSIPKGPEIKMVGFSRPGVLFPENADEFFDFFQHKIAERFLHHLLDDRMVESIKAEGRQLLHLANDIYRLGCNHDFWEVVVTADKETGSVTIDPRPRSLIGRTVEIEEHPQGGWTAKTSTHFVRADSRIEALAGLGRLIDRRDFHSSPPPPLVEKPWEPTCTCTGDPETHRGCVIHD